MKKIEKLCKFVIFSMFLVFLHSDLGYSAILPSWADEKAYYPVPPVFVHGFNSGPDAWGFKIDPATEKVIGYDGTSVELLKYFNKYQDLDPDEFVRSPYLEPFNYRYNTFDKMKWNAYEGYNDTELQYPDNRIPIATRFNRPVLKKFNEGTLSKYQINHDKIIAHSLGGPLSRWYLYNKGIVLAGGWDVPPGTVIEVAKDPELYPVRQLVTLGSPHLGVEWVALVNFICRISLVPWGDITPGQLWKLGWRVGLHPFLRGMPFDRDVPMVDDMEVGSDFLTELNVTPYHIPPIKYSCIAGFIYGPESILYPRPFHEWTDSFASVRSAWATKDSYSPSQLWLSSRDFEEEQPESILGPDYHAVLIDRLQIEPMPLIYCRICQHTELPNWWELVLKEIDPIGKIEITDPKAGFMPPEQGELVVRGKVYDEYLPADCKVKVEALLEGEMEERTIDNPNPEHGEEPWVWRLQPTDLWRADDLESPVAEFEIRIPEEYAQKTEKIYVTVTNPAGYSYENEVSWNLLIVDEGTKEVYCLDGPETMRTNSPKVVNEFKLIDEDGNDIESRPLGIAWDDGLGIFYVSFDDNKIRAYNGYGELVKTNSGRGYAVVPEIPDGLVNPFNYGRGWYVLEEISGAKYIDYFNEQVSWGTGVFLRIPPGKSCDFCWVSVRPTDGVLAYSTPWGLEKWYSSDELGLVREGWSGNYFTISSSIPSGFIPTGLVQKGPYFYLSGQDGKLYQKYCKNAQERVWVGHLYSLSGDCEEYFKLYPDDFSLWSNYEVMFYPCKGFWDFVGRMWRGFIRFDISDLPEEFYNVKIPMLIDRWLTTNVYLDVVETGWDYNDISWLNQPNVLSPLTHLIYPPVVYSTRYRYESWEEEVIDVTDAVRERLVSGEKTLDIRVRVDEEGEGPGRSVKVYLGPMYVDETTWAIDLPSDAPSDLGLGGKLKMRLKPGYPTSVNVGGTIQFEAHGKEPLDWELSDDTVGTVDSDGKFTAIGSGSCKVKVTDALENMAESLAIVVE